MTDDKKTALAPDEHHELCRRFAKGVVSGIPDDPDKLAATLVECFRAEARTVAEAILALKDHETVNALTGMLESHTKHASDCGCPLACLNATVAHRVNETVRGNETAAARAFLAAVVGRFTEAFAETVEQEERGFLQSVASSFFHKEYAHVLVVIVTAAKEHAARGDADDKDDREVN